MSSLNRLLFAMLSLHECDPAVVGLSVGRPGFFAPARLTSLGYLLLLRRFS
jgi:hypothetical protein